MCPIKTALKNRYNSYRDFAVCAEFWAVIRQSLRRGNFRIENQLTFEIIGDILCIQNKKMGEN